MGTGRVGGINLALVVIATCGVLFGVWGMLAGGQAAPAGTAPQLADPDEPQDSALADAPRPSSAATPLRPNATLQLDDRPEPNAKGPMETSSGMPSDSGDATIAGRVIDAKGQGAAGVTISARRSNLELGSPPTDIADLQRYRQAVDRYMQSAERERRVTVTDTDGNFSFRGLDSRLSYNLQAQSDAMGSGRADRVAAGDSPVIVLAPESLLRGRVQDVHEKPIGAFSVRTWRQGREWEGRSQSFTSEDGTFTIPGRHGSMTCEVTARGYARSEVVEVQLATDSPEVVFTLRAAAIVSGVVRDSAGRALSGASVYLGPARESQEGRWDYTFQRGTTTSTDSLGRYVFDTLSAGAHTISVTYGTFNSTSKIDAREGDNTLDFVVESGAIVSLKLSAAGSKPVDAEYVWFQGRANEGMQGVRLPLREPGLVEYAGLRPGDYTVLITASGWPSLRKPVSIVDGPNSFTFEFSEGATITGTVTGAGGTELQGISVRVRRAEDQSYGGWGSGLNALVRHDGRFRLGPMEPGAWKLEVMMNQSWKVVHSADVNVVVGENTHDLVVESAGTIVATITDSAGSPVPRAEVQLRGDQTYTGRADSHGVARISFVQPGNYQVIANASSQVSRVQPLTVNLGQNLISISLQAPNCARLTHIYPDTQAARIGLQVGDLILEYNTEQTGSWRALSQAIRRTKPADDVLILIERNGQSLALQLKGGTLGVEGADGVR